MARTNFLEQIKTHFVFSNFFPPENRTVYEIMWKKNIVERGRPQVTIWRMRIACRIPKTTNTHSVYVKPIVFPLQQWLHERALILRYFYMVWLVSHLRNKNAASVHGSFHPHYSLSRCHWG